MQKNKPSVDALLSHIIEGIETLKGQDISILDLREIDNTVCDYFVVCNGTSNTPRKRYCKLDPKTGEQIP